MLPPSTPIFSDSIVLQNNNCVAIVFLSLAHSLAIIVPNVLHIFSHNKLTKLLFFKKNQGYLQNLHVVTGHPNAHSLQCDRGRVESSSSPSPVESSPSARLDESCPTCGEFQALREALKEMREQHMAEMRELRYGIQQRFFYFFAENPLLFRNQVPPPPRRGSPELR